MRVVGHSLISTRKSLFVKQRRLMSELAQRDPRAAHNRARPRQRVPADLEQSANRLAVIPSTATGSRARFDAWHDSAAPSVRRETASARDYYWSTGIEFVLVLF
ncbi:hypothetical protein HU230_0007590 [Bradyrhizobium quebecense]|uniref:Uncharacterized protein n=1 Tax=Bradyrhizobium quebecense TaxID=2748629 RepID=A0A973WRZ6_9BRAD|nr:hypothetical protein [Bradyrhizobium quebecense]UGA45892.1 hypothetical protein HU230_0007590 [Bradyrhizobium quebecense]